MTGLEALLRWQHPVLGQVPPADFIPVCEEIGYIVELGGWVIDEAVGQLAAIRAQVPAQRSTLDGDQRECAPTSRRAPRATTSPAPW